MKVLNLRFPAWFHAPLPRPHKISSSLGWKFWGNLICFDILDIVNKDGRELVVIVMAKDEPEGPFAVIDLGFILCLLMGDEIAYCFGCFLASFFSYLS